MVMGRQMEWKRQPSQAVAEEARDGSSCGQLQREVSERFYRVWPASRVVGSALSVELERVASPKVSARPKRVPRHAANNHRAPLFHSIPTRLSSIRRRQLCAPSCSPATPLNAPTALRRIPPPPGDTAIMPGTRSRASAATQIHDDEDQQQETTSGLAFNEPLTWRAGKPIPVAELLRRLQALHQELRGLEQEEIERDALLPIGKELASQNLLSHKDRGVRAWAGCCVVDIFRLCAPDAPYTASQLKVRRADLCEP